MAKQNEKGGGHAPKPKKPTTKPVKKAPPKK
jgi:hypothetical protein